MGIVGRVYTQFTNNVKHGLNRNYGTPRGLRCHGNAIYWRGLCVATYNRHGEMIVNTRLRVVWDKPHCDHLLGLLDRAYSSIEIDSSASTPEQLCADARAQLGNAVIGV